jgi:hypothetical protein
MFMGRGLIRERDRLSFKAFLAEEAELEKRRREESERPLREAETAMQKSAREYAVYIRNLALTDKIDRYDETALAGVPRSTSEPDLEKALKAAAPWAASEPRYRRLSPEQREGVGELLFEFIKRNQLHALRVESWQRAFEILFHVGAIPVAPEPENEREPVDVIREPEQVIDSQPQMFLGQDPQTGLPREFTSRQIDRMDSKTFRKCFGLYGDATPRFIDPRF